MLNGLPGDPVMLLSVVNTKLRDHYHNLNVLCDDMNVRLIISMIVTVINLFNDRTKAGLRKVIS